MVTYTQRAVKTITKQHYADSSQDITLQVGNIETISNAQSSQCIGRERCVERDDYKCNANLYSTLRRNAKYVELSKISGANLQNANI